MSQWTLSFRTCLIKSIQCHLEICFEQSLVHFCTLHQLDQGANHILAHSLPATLSDSQNTRNLPVSAQSPPESSIRSLIESLSKIIRNLHELDLDGPAEVAIMKAINAILKYRRDEICTNEFEEDSVLEDFLVWIKDVVLCWLYVVLDVEVRGSARYFNIQTAIWDHAYFVFASKRCIFTLFN